MTILSLARNFFFLLALFLFACSNKEHVAEKEIIGEISYFEKIFSDTSKIFNGFSLGDEIENQTKEIVLAQNDLCTIIYTAVNNQLTSIKVECHIESNEIRDQLAQAILTFYNTKLRKEKSNLKFSSWSFVDPQNKPIEVLLISDNEIKLISLKIGYRKQI